MRASGRYMVCEQAGSCSTIAEAMSLDMRPVSFPIIFRPQSGLDLDTWGGPCLPDGLLGRLSSIFPVAFWVRLDASEYTVMGVLHAKRIYGTADILRFCSFGTAVTNFLLNR